MKLRELKFRLRLTWLLRGNWIHNLLLALIPAVIFIITMPTYHSKYNIEYQTNMINRFAWFDDLQNDQKKEKFYTGLNPDSTLYLLVYNEQDEFLGQYNFNHPPANIFNIMDPFSIDINMDDCMEVLLFTQNEDSLFLNVFDYQRLEIVKENIFITKIGGFNDKKDYRVFWVGAYDANGDHIKEGYFSVAAGFALFPRRVFRYDFVNDSLISSPNTAAAPIAWMMSQEDDPFTLWISSGATANIPTDYPFPYHDTCCWIFGFNKDLEFRFNPISVGSYPNRNPIPYFLDDRSIFLVIQNNPNNPGDLLLEMDLHGNIIDSFSFELGNFNHVFHELIINRKKVVYLSDWADQKRYKIKLDTLALKVESKYDFLKDKHPVLQEDLNEDGRLETLLRNRRNSTFHFYPDGQFRNSFIIAPSQSYYIHVSANYYPESSSGLIILSGASNSEIYTYFRNPKYQFRFLVWFLIYLISVIFVAGIMYLQQRRTARRHQFEKELADLQLQNLRNQLDPHFTFNALNSVGYAIYQEDKEKAYDLFQRFTRLIRFSLTTSQQVFAPLKDEIQFTRDYLEFQKTRFKDLFDYEFIIDPAIDLEKTDIPKMLVQGFTENAVKHAFHRIKYKGHIRVTVGHTSQGVSIEIEDNGVGISMSKELASTSGTQIGTKLLQDQIQQINKLYNRNIRIQIMDGPPREAEGRGTIVEILLH